MTTTGREKRQQREKEGKGETKIGRGVKWGWVEGEAGIEKEEDGKWKVKRW